LYTAVKIKKRYSTHLECVIKYYAILNVLNNLSLSKGDINILSFTCVYGHIGSLSARTELIRTFDMSKRYVKALILSLIKRGFLTIVDGKTVINKQLHIEFDSLLLKIHIEHETA